MRKLQKWNLCIAFLLSFFALYFFGNLQEIRPDLPAFGNSLLLLIVLHIFFIATLTFSLYQLLREISQRSPMKDLLLIISCLLSCVVIYFTVINPPFMQGFYLYVSGPYIVVGDFLRDQYGINWYFMDWGRWMVTASLYFLPIWAYVIYLILHLFIHKIRTRVKRKD